MKRFGRTVPAVMLIAGAFPPRGGAADIMTFLLWRFGGPALRPRQQP